MNREPLVLLESEDVYRGLLEVCPDPIVVHQDFKFVYANEAALRLFRAQDFAQLGGKFILERVPREEREPVSERINSVLNGIHAPPRQVRLLTLEGGMLMVEAESVPVAWHGRPAAVTVFRSPSRRSSIEGGKAEAAREQVHLDLQASNRALDQAVRERTHELRQTVMDLHGFSYALMHDLRAPLRAIHSFISLLEQECGPCREAPFDDYISRVQRSVERMDDLIRDSLNYSKLLRYPLPLSAVNVGELLRGMLETYPRWQQPGVDIQLARDLPTVMGNAAALTECFSNLLDNAIKFAKPETPPKVRVRAERRGPGWRIYVEDNGIGIEPGQAEKLFDLFFRLENKSNSGTGIGLAIVRKAVERMRGKAGVDPVPEGGSRFWIELESPPDAGDGAPDHP